MIEEALIGDDLDSHTDPELTDNIYFKKFIQIKKYLKRNENRFVELERANLKAIKQIYAMLNPDQKLRLIRNPIIDLFIRLKFFHACYRKSSIRVS